MTKFLKIEINDKILSKLKKNKKKKNSYDQLYIILLNCFNISVCKDYLNTASNEVCYYNTYINSNFTHPNHRIDTNQSQYDLFQKCES